MCDCTLKENNENALDAGSMTTITIFEKCSKLPIQRADYADEALDDGGQKQYAANEILVVPTVTSFGIKNSRAYVPSTKVSSENFNDSIMTDNVTDERNLECAIGCEDTIYDTECICSNENSDDELDVERTLAIIKPETIGNLNAIENTILDEGFELQGTKYLRMTPEQVSEFYDDNYGTKDLTNFVAYMSSGSIAAKVLARKEAINRWRFLMGPTKVTEARLYYPESIRAQHGRKGADYKNSVHGSSTRKQAEREINFFFPEFVVEPLLEGKNAENYLREVISSFLAKGLAACCIVKPAEPILWLANWLLDNNPRVPKLVSQNHSK